MKNTAFFDAIDPEADIFLAFQLDSGAQYFKKYKERKAERAKKV